MITDDNKGITNIDYNILNLPKRIEINGGTSATTGELEYTYDAAGTKLKKLLPVAQYQQQTMLATIFIRETT